MLRIKDKTLKPLSKKSKKPTKSKASFKNSDHLDLSVLKSKFVVTGKNKKRHDDDAFRWSQYQSEN
jgi:hypothetical protein